MPTTLMCEPRLLQKDLHDRVYIVTGLELGCRIRHRQAALSTACIRRDERTESVTRRAGSTIPSSNSEPLDTDGRPQRCR